MVQQITLMEAYLIEAIEQKEIEKNKIIDYAKDKQLHLLNETIDGNFDFGMLNTIAEQLPSILQDGYQVKFLTFPGLQRLLQLKVNKKEHLDYKIEDFTIKNLQLTKSEAEIVHTFLSSNWKLTASKNGYCIHSSHS